MARGKVKNDMPLLDFLLVEEKQIENVKPKYEKFTEQLLTPKYRPIGKLPVFMLVIKNPDGEEVSHWSCESVDVDDFKTSSEKRGKLVEVYPIQEYYEKVNRNEFQMVKRSEPKWQKK